jgi:acyl-CoA synthetase (AMP-forming)/AMP-acid ligase II
MSFNLAFILSESAHAAPDKPVAVFDGGQLTYRQLDQASDRLAANLASAGIGPGDRVALQLPNIPQFLISYFGILKAGAAVVPLNVLLRAPEIAYHLEDSGALVLITWEGVLAEAAKGAEVAGIGAIFAVGHADALPGVLPFERLLDGAAPPFEMATRQPTDTAVIVYTSGTTGQPMSPLRVAISGGASIPAAVLDAFEERLGVVILEGYGMTETAATTTFNPSAAERRAYSVGKPIWGTQTQVWDDQGRPLPPGPEHVGEIVTRGLHVMKGYLNRPEATAEAFTGDWLHTGDLGYFDEDGFLFIVSRKKELIIRGGYNVYPSEIENVLHAHPAVAEAAVVGVPDERLGEEVMAVVIVRATMELGELELVSWCRERLAAYKCPRVFQFRSELPKNALGKILKDELAQAGTAS